MSKNLIDEAPLVLLPSLAVAIGLNEAIFTQQIHYWLQTSKNTKYGRKWTYNTLPQWREQMPFFSTRTLQRTISSLTDSGILLVDQLSDHKSDRTNYYSIDYDKLAEACRQNVATNTTKRRDHDANLSSSTNATDCRHGYTDTTKTTTKTTTDTLDDGLKPAAPTEAEEKKARQEANAKTWDAYSKAYEKRYGTAPIRNQQINGIIARFVKSVPMDEAPLIARYFININNQFYVQKMHPVKLLLNDADSIRTQWATNKTMSATTARQADQFQAAKSAADGAAERYAKRHGIVFGEDALDGECKHV